ncbi:MAG: YbaB/EbfC family nucleoid-associated protein [Elusimicrobiota bacterium]
MFDKLKELKKLKDLHDAMSKEKLENEKDGIKIVMNGKMEVESVTLNPSLDKERQEKALKELINDTIRKIQMSMAQKMGGLKGLM